MRKETCECSDPQCPVHDGKPECSYQAKQTLYRIDMEDMSGTRFCRRCAEDAYSSGVFSDSTMILY